MFNAYKRRTVRGRRSGPNSSNGRKALTFVADQQQNRSDAEPPWVKPFLRALGANPHGARPVRGARLPPGKRHTSPGAGGEVQSGYRSHLNFEGLP